MRLLSATLCLVLFGLSFFAMAPLQVTNFFKGSALMQEAEDAVERRELIGVTLLLGSPEETVVKVIGVRSSEHETPIQANDQWTLASNSKSIVSLLMAEAVDKGLLKWSSAVRDFWKDFPVQDVNVSDVLLHTSKISDQPQVFQNATLMSEIKRLETISEVRRAMSVNILRENTFEPSSLKKFNYAHTNSLVAAIVLENVFGTPFEVLVENKIFKAFGLSSCGFGPAGSESVSSPQQPWGHLATETGWQTIPPTSVADFPEFMNPSARVHCSMSDYAKYLKEWNSIFRFESQRISLSSQRALAESHSNSPYVLGGWIGLKNRTGQTYYAHAGNNFFEALQTSIYPEHNFFVSVSANSADVKTRQLLDSTIQRVEHQFGVN